MARVWRGKKRHSANSDVIRMVVWNFLLPKAEKKILRFPIWEKDLQSLHFLCQTVT